MEPTSLPLVSKSGERDQSASEQIGLVRRAQKGDEEAFRLLFDHYQRPIFGLLYHATGEREEAADLAQETFVRAFRALPSLKAPAAFGPWLRRIAQNLCRDHFKRPRLSVSSLDSDSAGGYSRPREIIDPAGDVAAGSLLEGELSEAVEAAIAALSPDHRAVIRLHHLEELSVEEIARTMRCPVGTVKSRLARAREQLKELLRDYVEK